MSDPDQASAQQLFSEALELPPLRREAHLRRACGENAQLYAAVQSLLAAHAQAVDSFLAKPAVEQFARDETLASSSSADVFERAGAWIGPYQLLEQIGEGGFGTVFLAEQSAPVRRRVALKIIKLGMDTRQVIARFEAERQALAILDHPSIAKVFDAGTTATGRPYFVMELVRGSPITQYCDARKLSPRQRLELFVPVCQAVQHAHNKGIIHRDLKPTNVLVTEQDDQPVPKVIDFGVAKATQARLSEQTLFTEFRQMVGTPAYMSPEQASLDATASSDVDTRSDVYSLGVLLYELLTGTTPFEEKDLRRGAYDQMQRMIREQEPPKPSTRLSAMADTIASVAAMRSIEPRQLSRAMRGELDWIVMKCLEKDRARRYESASSLAAEVNRHLAGEAVLAGKPSAVYRMKKLARRHRVALAVVCVFLVGAIGAASFYIHGIRAEQRKTMLALTESERQAAIAQAVSRFQSDMLAAADPRRQLGEQVTVLQVLTAAVAELDAGKLKDQPLVEAAVRTTIGVTLQELGQYDAAEPNFRKALQLRRANLPALHLDIATSVNHLAWLLHNRAQVPIASERKMSEAEALYREALAIRHKTLRQGHALIGRSMNDLGVVLWDQRKYGEAESLLRGAMEIYRRELPASDLKIANCLNNLGKLLPPSKHAEAEQYFREALQIDRAGRQGGDPELITSLENLGRLLMAQEKYAEAEPLLREALDICRKAMPARHRETNGSLIALAVLLRVQGKFTEAEPLFRESLEIAPDNSWTMSQYGLLLQAEGRFAEAEPLFRATLNYRSSQLGPKSNGTRLAADRMATLLEATGRAEEAAALRKQYAPPDPTTLPVTGSSRPETPS